MTPKQQEQEQEAHWLVRPRTIRLFWIVGSLILALTVVLQLVIKVKGYFVVDGWFGFGAVFGFLCCVAMVLVAKGLGRFIKRDQNYYQDGQSDD